MPVQTEVAAAAASGSLSDAESAAADPGFGKGLTASVTQGRVDLHAVNVFFKVGFQDIPTLLRVSSPLCTKAEVPRVQVGIARTLCPGRASRQCPRICPVARVSVRFHHYSHSARGHKFEG